MSSLPNIELINGLFTYENCNRPVFKDNNGTHHYDIGEKMERTLQAYISQHHNPAMEELKQQISYLQSEVLKTHEIAQHAFLAGLNEQWKVDRHHIQSSQSVLEKKDTENEILRQLLLASQKENEKLTQENKCLKNKVQGLSKQVKSSQKVNSLSKECQSNKQTGERVNKRQNSRKKNGKERDCNDASSTHKSKIGPDPDSNRSVENESSEIHSGDAVSSSNEEKIERFCADLMKNPTSSIPNWVKQYVYSIVIDVSSNFNKGIPKLLHFLEMTRNLPDSVSIASFFPSRVDSKYSGLSNALKASLKSRQHNTTVCLLIGEFRQQLNGKSYKEMRKRLQDQQEKLYSSVEQCLADNQYDLANQKLNREISQFREGDDPQLILTDLKLFTSQQECLSLARDRILQLLKKDMLPFERIKDLLIDLMKRFEQERPGDRESLYEKIAQFGIAEEALIGVFGDMQAKLSIEKQLAAKNISVELIEYWINRKNDLCDQAFWSALGRINASDKAIFESCIQSLHTLIEDKRLPKVEWGNQVVSSILHFNKIWAKKRENFQSVPAIGDQLAAAWTPLLPIASSSQRKEFVEFLGKGIEQGLGEPHQYLCYLDLLLKELNENREKWKVNHKFYRKIFASARKMSETGNLYEREKLANSCREIWETIDFMQMQRFLADELQAPLLYEELEKLLRIVNQNEDKEMISIRSQTFVESLKAYYRTAVEESGIVKKLSLPQNLMLKAEEVAFASLMETDESVDPLLIRMRFLAYARDSLLKSVLGHLQTLQKGQYEHLESLRSLFSHENEAEYCDDEQVKESQEQCYLALTRAVLAGSEDNWSLFEEEGLEFALEFLLPSKLLTLEELKQLVKLCAASSLDSKWSNIPQLLVEIEGLVDKTQYIEIILEIANIASQSKDYNYLLDFLIDGSEFLVWEQVKGFINELNQVEIEDDEFKENLKYLKGCYTLKNINI